MPDEALMDAPVVSQINPNTVIKPAPSTLQVAQPTAQPTAEKPLFNSMADKLTDLLKEVKSNKEAPKKEVPSEPAKTEPAKADAASDADESKWTSKKAAEWKALKSRISEVETKSKNLADTLKAKETEIETLKKTPALDPKELETLKAERDQLASKLDMVALERHPKFDAHFKKIFEAAINAAKDSVADVESKEKVESLMNLKPSKYRKEQISAIMESMDNEYDRVAFSTAIQQMDRARAERDDELANAKDRLEKIQTAEAANRTKQADLEKASRMDKVAKVMTLAPNFDAFNVLDGDDNHNNQIPQRQERVKKALLGELPEQEMLLMPMMAVEGEHLRTNVLPQMVAKMKEMETTIKQLQGSQPTMDGHGAQPTADRGQGTDQENGFIGRFNKLYRGPQRRGG